MMLIVSFAASAVPVPAITAKAIRMKQRTILFIESPPFMESPPFQLPPKAVFLQPGSERLAL